MTMRRDLKWFKHEIAEILFGKDLDEAYSQGMRIGSEYATFKLSFEVTNQAGLTLTKTEQRGYDHALEAISRVKPDIAKKTGAMV